MWGVNSRPQVPLAVPLKERQELAEYLERQTFILLGEQYGKGTGPTFKDRQLEMAVVHLR